MKIAAALISLLVACQGCQGLAAFPAAHQIAHMYHEKPEHTQYAKVARWLVHENDWGVVSTISRHLGGTPYGHTVSFSDGPKGESTGRLLFYLTTMDAAAQDLQADSRATFTVCEAQLPGACQGIDPEDPTCAKLSLSGRLTPVPPEQLQEAQRLLFARHPAMRDWPKGHGFRVYELHIETMALLDFYGGAHYLTPEEYFGASLGEQQEAPLTAQA